MELIFARHRKVQPIAQTLRLEMPPTKKPIEKVSLLQAILPSMAMSVPMLAGYAIMRRLNSKNGTISGNYMVLGLVTAIGSALIGVILGITNYKNKLNKMRRAERLRKRSYRTYLQNQERRLTELEQYLRNMLHYQYPPSDELIDLNRKKVMYYREEVTAEEPMMIRLGIGSRASPILESASAKSDDAESIRDVLELERLRVYKAHSVIADVPIVMALTDGNYTIQADKLTTSCSLLITILIQISLSYNICNIQWLFLLKSPYFLRETAWKRFLPNMLPDLITYRQKGLNDDECTRLIIIAEEYDDIPSELRAKEAIRILLTEDSRAPGTVISENDSFSGFLSEDGELQEVCFETIRYTQAELAARCLCPFRYEWAERNGRLPTHYPFMKMLTQASMPWDAQAIAKRWGNASPIDSLAVPIGITTGGNIVYLDTHEKSMGPHGLIAGMTGSGKSELLMTFILSLALDFPPKYVGFFLIDYKGGGMSGVFRRLPHVLSSISNLSGDLIQRAFLSIRSENERRMRIFAEVGVNHISEYYRLIMRGRQLEMLPHIYVIIDEFAQLKKEEPEFMQELVALSRVGRSLGIHLILCTQKPGGSVDSAILSNSRFQIALRLQDMMDSKELIKHPDAADLVHPGRAILRVGNDEIYEKFQCAYSLCEAGQGQKEIAYLCDEYGNRLPDNAGDNREFKSQLEELLNCIIEANQKENVSIRRLCCNPLPKVLKASELKSQIIGWMPEVGEEFPEEISERGGVAVGIWDNPYTQQQGVFKINLSSGHHFLCGMPKSGKSTFMETFLKSLSESGAEAAVYVADYGAGALKGCRFLQQVKCYYDRSEATEIAKMLETFAGNLLTDYEADRNSAMNSDKVVYIIIDSVGDLLKETGLSVRNSITKLLKFGENHRIYLMLSACGIGSEEVSRGWQNYMTQTICFRMPDAYSYGEILNEAHFKGNISVPGRGYVRMQKEIVAFQTMIYTE